MDAINFLVKFLGSDCKPVADGSVPKLTTKDQGEISGLATVACYITEQSSKASQLLGSSPEEKAQIDEWLASATTELQPLVDDKLIKVNDWLLSRTYLVGNAFSVADIIVFGVVQPAVVTFPAAQTAHFTALLRWFDLISYQTCAPSSFEKTLSLTKPAFVAPIVAIPAPKEVKPAGDAKPAGDGKKAAAAPAASSSSSAPKVDAKSSAPAEGGDTKKGEGKKESKPAAEVKESKPAAEGGDAKKGEKKGKESKEAKGNPPKKEEEELHIGMLDIRVGTIVKVGPHPNAESLYLEEIDLGEEKPRQVISGLVKFVPLDKMENRRVLVVCNLKPAKMRDIISYGMVLCASNDTHDIVDPVIPPEGVPNGERITFEGYDKEPLPEINPKKKILDRLLPDMKTDGACAPNYKGLVFNTTKGAITATIANATVG
eukprot:gene22930-30109_t